MNFPIYIHIPFCRKKCPYCDFYSVADAEESVIPYLKALRRHMAILSREQDVQASTIYIGGGTPSMLDNESLTFLLGCIREYFLKNDSAREFSVEVNPESVTQEKLKIMRAYQVNRLSIGVQSFNDQKLAFLKRPHTAAQAEQSIRAANETGFKNISIDLMYGLAGESPVQWKNELQKAASYQGVTHISAYALTCDSNKLRVADETLAADMYCAAMEILPRTGFLQYEVSSFARESFACRHNQAYWNNDAYIGIGSAAVSYRDGAREQYCTSIKEYTESLFERGQIPVEHSERLGALPRAKETAALQIRRKEGIDFIQFQEKTGFDFLYLKQREISALIGEGLLENVGVSGVRATPRGFLFCDRICGEFLT